jgi:tetratricopeptide (TPR) repeat protein
MSTKTQSESYTKALELAERGDHQESLVYFQQHLQDQPNDAEALSDTGAVLYCLGETDQAVEHFKKAVTADKYYGQSYWNLAEAYITDGKAHLAAELFDDMQRLEILNPDQTIRTANIFLEQSDKGAAIEMMLKTVELSDKLEIVEAMIDVVKSKRPKIAFFQSSENNSFYEFASKRFMTESFTSKTAEELPDLINWCDIAWFDEIDENLSRALALPKVCKIVVNSSSADKESLSSNGIDVDKIDKLIENAPDGDSCYLNNILLELEKDEN